MWTLAIGSISIIGFGVLLTALEVSRWDHRSVLEVTGFDPMLYSFAGVNVAQLAFGVLGVLVMTSEYSSGTIRITLAATPQRRLLLMAKVTTFSVLIGIVSFLSCVATFFVCQVILEQKGAGLSIGDSGVALAVVGGAVHLVLVGIIAVGLGAAMRRTAGAIAVLFTVLLIVPGLVSLLPSPWNNDVTRYLPNSAGAAMSAVIRFPNLLTPWAGFAVLTLYAALMLMAASYVLQRSDA
jgi:ABC-type transport system involved in multi-copper enzyme maturation permease subunit